jgi:cobalamin synthase
VDRTFESAALLTAFPVPARRATSVRGVLSWAPLVGLLLGCIAAGVAVVSAGLVSPLTGAVLAVGVLAALTRGLLALVTAVVTARLAMARAGLPGVAVAEGSSLGRTVAGTVSRPWLAGVALVAAALVAAAALLVADPAAAGRLLAAASAGLLVAELLHHRATSRLGGTTGEVMGATGEAAMTTSLLVSAALWP